MNQAGARDRDGDGPVAMAYWAGWANDPIPDLYFRLGLAFALLEGNGTSEPYWTNYEKSGNFENWGPEGTTYYTWNHWLRTHGNGEQGAITQVCYGGATDENSRRVITDGTALDNLAGEIKANIEKYFFGGLDLDIEGWWLYDRASNERFAKNLVQVVDVVANGIPSWKPITVAVGASAAGPIPSVGPDNYTGTMAPFLTDPVMAKVSRINIMSYNLDIENLYGNLDDIGAILRTFTDLGVDARKLSIGIQPIQQSGQPSASLDTVEQLGAYLRENGYGGAFLWGIGAPENPSYPTSAEYMTRMMKGLGLI
ncbi:hypothetical protein [Pendulispora albinea]|uniref:Chitinase n=1 Tax=Pendulispora albinea TaxID=2741071 RepID=A0ABZ2M3S5_9BACT